MKTRLLLLVAACAVLVLAAAQPKNRAVEKEIQKFQGEWKFTSFIVEGVAKTPEEYGKYKIIFKGDLWTAYEGDEIAAQSTFVPNPKAKPKSLEIHFKMENDQTRLIRGIYKFKKDTLTICDRREERGPRPTRFESKPDTGLILVKMKRVGS